MAINIKQKSANIDLTKVKTIVSQLMVSTWYFRFYGK